MARISATIDESKWNDLFENTCQLNTQFIFLKVSQPCEEMLVLCRYGGVEYENCMKIFTSILTDEGLLFHSGNNLLMPFLARVEK